MNKMKIVLSSVLLATIMATTTSTTVVMAAEECNNAKPIEQQSYLSSKGVNNFIFNALKFIGEGVLNIKDDGEIKLDIRENISSYIGEFPVLVLDEKKTKEDVNVKINEAIAVCLEENASTGYVWSYKIENTDIIDFLKDGTEEKNNELVGAPINHCWGFKAKKQGETDIIFKLYRKWEGEKSSIKTIKYHINVTNKDVISEEKIGTIGVVKSVTETKNGIMALVKGKALSSAGQNEIMLNINDDTDIVDECGKKLGMDSIKKGVKVKAYYGAAITKSLPPIGNAIKIIIMKK